MTPRDRIALTAAVVLVALLGAWFGVVAPRRADADAAQQALAQARTRVSAAHAAVQAPQTPVDARDAMAVAASLGKALPTDDGTTSLGVQLQALATQSHVVLNGISLATAGAPGAAPTTSGASAAPAATTTTPAAATTPAAGAAPAATPVASDGTTPPGTTVDADGYTTLPLDLTFSGSYLDVQRLLGRIAALVRVQRDGHVDVHGRLLTISAISLSPRAGGSGRVDATARAVAYLAPEDLALVPDVTARDTALSASPASAPAPDAATPTSDTRIG